MTGRLTEVLSGGLPPGVYRSPGPADPDEIGRVAAAAGWGVHLLDGRATGSKAELLAAVGEALSFPEWYGRNWDALADCLSDLSWLAGRGEVLIWHDYGVLAVGDPDAWRVAYEVLAWARPSVPLVVVLTGDGPAHSPVDGTPIPLL